MHDIAPSTLHRMLRLRHFSLFADADLDELATVAENVTIATIAPGKILAEAGRTLDAIHLILDGQLRADAGGHTWGPRHVFGALEVFARRCVSSNVVAATELQTLRISSQEVGELLEDNFGLLRATLRELATRLVHVAYATPTAGADHIASRPLGLVERLIVLRKQFPYSSARLQALAALAHASEEVTWPAHTDIATADAPAADSFVVLDGSLATHLRTFSAGAHIGCIEGLAGLPHGATITTTTPVRALRTSAATLLDVIEDHTDMGVAMIASFADALLATALETN